MLKSISFCIAIWLLCVGCTKNSNRIDFIIDSKYNRVNIQVCLQDSIIANMMFDTGAVDGIFRLDSAFVAAHPSLMPETRSKTSRMGSAWGVFSVPSLFYDTIFNIGLGQTNLTYDNLTIYNMRKALGVDGFDGIFNMPKNDTLHVWEWNFEHNYLKIHATEDFTMPADCYLCPMETQEDYAYYIQLSMKIITQNDNTLSIQERFWVDMGMPNDVAVLHPSEVWTYFDEKDSCRTECQVDNFGRFYTVNAELFDNYALDSIPLYVNDHSYSLPSKYLLGLNFIKRFNLFFDMKHQQLGLQPVKEYKRINPGKQRRFHYNVKVTENITWIVTKMGKWAGNVFLEAGLQEGDEIIGINGIPLKIMTNEQFEELEGKSFTYNVIRRGEYLDIVISKIKQKE